MPSTARLHWLLVPGIALGLVFSTAHARAEELTLARALKLAKDRAAEMRVARAKVAAADAQKSLARSPYFPSLTATGNTSYAGTSQVTAGFVPGESKSVYYTASVAGAGALRWTLYDFGRTSNSVASAEAVLAAVNAGALDTEATLVDTVAAAYFGVIYGERIRDIQRSIVEQRERFMAIVKGLVKQAISPAVDEVRTQGRIDAARRDLEQAEGDLAEARTVLFGILGLEPRSSISVATPKLPSSKLDAQAASKEAEAHRPSLVSARATAEAQEAAADAASSRYWPSLGITGDASYGYSKLDVFNAWLPARSASGGVVLTIPIYDPTNGAQVDIARAQAAEAAATYDLQRRDARTDATRTVVRLTAAEKVLDHAARAADSSAAVLTVVRARYAQGLSNILDLIEAETEDANARLSAARAQQARDTAAVHLFVTTGRAGRLYEGP